jgi:hypothetical protein
LTGTHTMSASNLSLSSERHKFPIFWQPLQPAFPLDSAYIHYGSRLQHQQSQKRKSFLRTEKKGALSNFTLLPVDIFYEVWIHSLAIGLLLMDSQLFSGCPASSSPRRTEPFEIDTSAPPTTYDPQCTLRLEVRSVKRWRTTLLSCRPLWTPVCQFGFWPTLSCEYWLPSLDNSLPQEAANQIIYLL